MAVMLHHKAFFLILGFLFWAGPLKRAYWTAAVKGKGDNEVMERVNWTEQCQNFCALL